MKFSSYFHILFAPGILISLYSIISFVSDVKIFGLSFARKNLLFFSIPVFMVFSYSLIFVQYQNYYLTLTKPSLLNNTLLIILILSIFGFNLINQAFNALIVKKTFGLCLFNLSSEDSYISKRIARQSIGWTSFLYLKSHFQTSLDTNNYLSLIDLVLVISFGILVASNSALDKVELRERGICGMDFCVEWNKIKFYKFDNEELLYIQLDSFWPFVKHIILAINSDQKDSIDALLQFYLPNKDIQVS